MAESLIIRGSVANGGAYPCVVTLRTATMAETDYTSLFRLTAEEALSVAGDHTGLHFMYDQSGMPDVEKKHLGIARTPDRKPGQRAFILTIGGEPVTREKEGERKFLHLSDETVDLLEEHLAHLEAERGEPDWDRRAVENLEDRATSLEEEASRARSAAVAARAAYDEKLRQDALALEP